VSTVQRTSQARVVIAGAGFAAFEAALALREFGRGAAHVYLLTTQREFVFTPASTRELFGPVPRTRWPLHELAMRAGAAVIPGALASVDAAGRRLLTVAGDAVDYDYAIVAVGGRPEPWLEAPGLTFIGTEDVPDMGRELDRVAERVAAGATVDVVFVVPPGGGGWVIPAYELALMARRYFDDHGVGKGARLAIVTSEDAPLGVFGEGASQSIAHSLANADIALHAGTVVRGWSSGHLRTVPGGMVPADLVIALPAIAGPRVRGLPQTSTGFVDAASDGRVRGLDRVFVAGDAGPFPIKQAGLACQQSDSVAAAICTDLGIDVPDLPPSPVLRGLLWSANGDKFLRRDLAGGHDESQGSVSVTTALWWPPGKVAGRFLTPFLHQIEALELVDVPMTR
jgi:sulfide:quinone oxidoreductase